MDTIKTLESVRTWPMANQLDLVFRMWDQIVDSGWQPIPSPELVAELNRRIERHESNPEAVLTWKQVEEHVQRVR